MLSNAERSIADTEEVKWGREKYRNREDSRDINDVKNDANDNNNLTVLKIEDSKIPLLLMRNIFVLLQTFFSFFIINPFLLLIIFLNYFSPIFITFSVDWHWDHTGIAQ